MTNNQDEEVSLILKNKRAIEILALLLQSWPRQVDLELIKRVD